MTTAPDLDLLERATAFLRVLREGLDVGLDLPAALVRGSSALPHGARERVRTVARRLEDGSHEDEWGFDEGLVEAVRPLLDFLYTRWWRVGSIGIENVPAHGRVLLAANHAGVLPWDAAMISVGILREHPLPRHARFLALDRTLELPVAGALVRKLGGVAASSYNARRLLGEDRLVTVFPEGSRAAGKPRSERYRVQSFGRGGFVEVALRSAAPIVPVAVVGSEEIGPLGPLPFPSRWRIEYCPPLETASYGAQAADDRTLVLELSERVRATIQARVEQSLATRGPAF